MPDDSKQVNPLNEGQIQPDGQTTLAFAGFAFFPIPYGKKAGAGEFGAKHNHTTATTDILGILEFPTRCNVGVTASKFAGPNYGVIIDVDKDALEAFEALEREHDRIPGFRVRTPSGLHIYALVPFPVESSARKFGIKGVDIRAQTGGHVVGPDSYFEGDDHKPAGHYTVIDAAPPQFLSSFWQERLVKIDDHTIRSYADVKARRGNKEPAVALDTPAKIAKGRDMLRHAEPAIEGQKGDHHTYSTMAAVLDRAGVSAEMLFRLATEEDGWNSRCSPPWDEFGLWVKICNAERYMQNRQGQGAKMLDHMERQAIEEAAREADPFCDGSKSADSVESVTDDSEVIAVKAGALLSRERVPTRWIFDRLIPHLKVCPLDGRGGVHKSRFALQALICALAKCPLAGRPVGEEVAAAVLISCEDDQEELQRRILDMCRTLEIDPAIIEDRLHIIDRVSAETSYLASFDDSGAVTYHPFRQKLADFLNSIPGHKLVALDSAYDFAHFKGATKSDDACVRRWLKGVLRDLGDKTDSTLILLRHASKASSTTGDAAGHVAQSDSVRHRLHLEQVMTVPKKGSGEKPKPIKGRYTLSVAKSNLTEDGARIELKYSGGALVLAPSGLLATEAERKAREAAAVSAVAQRRRMAVGLALMESNDRGHGWTKNRPIMQATLDRINAILREEKDPEPLDATEARAVLLDCASAGMVTYIDRSGARAGGWFFGDAKAANERSAAIRKRQIDKLAREDVEGEIEKAEARERWREMMRRPPLTGGTITGSGVTADLPDEIDDPAADESDPEV